MLGGGDAITMPGLNQSASTSGGEVGATFLRIGSFHPYLKKPGFSCQGRRKAVAIG